MNRLVLSTGAVAALVLVGVLATSGCAPLVCPAIGWTNTLTVQRAENSDAVAHVQICFDEQCSPSGATDTDGNAGLIGLIEHLPDVWVYAVGMASPDEVTVRGFDAENVAVSNVDVSPHWNVEDDHGGCGGPASAVVVVDF